ncbi:hypothetical protein ISS22_08015 [candidate division KSB1 bacterium]|nr:hypothetical protein [candidate division KSB1 bacterium]
MNDKKVYSIILILTILLSSITSQAFSQSIRFQSKPADFLIGGQLTFDIYKPYFSLYLNLKRYDRPTIIKSGDEAYIYSDLIRRLYAPRFVLFQTTFYQFSALSSYLEKDHPKIFNRFNTYFDINIIRSIGSGFEEPYSFSLFMGNIVLLGYDSKNNNDSKPMKQAGSALAGFLMSSGNHQICDNIYLDDRWYQYEFMLVGDLREKNFRRISWNFRFGFKHHSNKLFRNVFLFSVERNHSTWEKTGFSFIKNSVFKYKSYVPASFSDNPPVFVYHHFSFGKKIPIKFLKRKIFLVLAGGIRWERIYRYNRFINKFDLKPSGNFIWLIQPNIEF